MKTFISKVKFTLDTIENNSRDKLLNEGGHFRCNFKIYRSKFVLDLLTKKHSSITQTRSYYSQKLN